MAITIIDEGADVSDNNADTLTATGYAPSGTDRVGVALLASKDDVTHTSVVKGSGGAGRDYTEAVESAAADGQVASIYHCDDVDTTSESVVATFSASCDCCFNLFTLTGADTLNSTSSTTAVGPTTISDSVTSNSTDAVFACFALRANHSGWSFTGATVTDHGTFTGGSGPTSSKVRIYQATADSPGASSTTIGGSWTTAVGAALALASFTEAGGGPATAIQDIIGGTGMIPFAR